MINKFDNIFKKLRHYTLEDKLIKNNDSPHEFKSFLDDNVLRGIRIYSDSIVEDTNYTVNEKLNEIKRVKNMLIKLYSKKPVENIFDAYKKIEKFYCFNLLDLYLNNKTVDTFTNKKSCNLFESILYLTPSGFKDEISKIDLYNPHPDENENYIEYYYFKLYGSLKLFIVQNEIKMLIDELEYEENQFEEHSNATYVDSFFAQLYFNIESKECNFKDFKKNIEEQYSILLNKLDGSCYESHLRLYPKTDIQLVFQKYNTKLQELLNGLFFLNEVEQYQENKKYLVGCGVPDFDMQNPQSETFFETIRDLDIYKNSEFKQSLNNYIKLFENQKSVLIENVLDRGRLRILNMMDVLQPDEKTEDWIKEIASEYFSSESLKLFDILVRRFLITKEGEAKPSYSKCFSVLKYLKEKTTQNNSTFKIKKDDFMKLLKRIDIIDVLPSRKTRNIKEDSYEKHKEQIDKILMQIKIKI